MSVFIRFCFALCALSIGLGSAHAATVSIDRNASVKTAYESASPTAATVVFVRTNDSNTNNLTVTFSITPSTANLTGADYTLSGHVAMTSTIIIPAGSSIATLTITPSDDALVEGTESMTVSVVATSYSVGSTQSVTIDIADDDIEVSLSVPDPTANEDKAATPPAGDLTATRRALIRANISDAPAFGGTNVTVALTPGVTPGVATLVTDYAIQYHIGGGGFGAVSSYVIAPRYCYLAGDTTLSIAGVGSSHDSGSTISINGQNYTTTTALSPGSTSVTIAAPGLVAPVSNSDVILDNMAMATGFFVAQTNTKEPLGSTTLVLAGGTGDFQVGDVFRIGSDASTSYVVSNWNNGTNTLTFTWSTTSVGSPPAAGLTSNVTGAQSIVTRIPATMGGVGGHELSLFVPASSTLIEYAIVPVTDDSSPVIEGAETVTMQLLTNTDYEVVSPSVAEAIIADDDAVVSFNPSLNVDATEGGNDGSFTVVLSSAFPRAINIPYLIGGTATNTTDYTTLTGTLTIPAGQLSGTITVSAINDALAEPSGETVTLTLVESDDYRLATTTSATINSSSTITINDLIGTVSIVATQAGAQEGFNGATTTNGLFTVTIDSGGSATVNYTVSGTATPDDDYLTTNLTGSVLVSGGTGLISIAPVDNFVPEDPETVVITLTSGMGYIINGAQSSATVIINDDEPTISITKLGDPAEGDSPTARFRVSYAAATPLNRQFTVPITWTGTATKDTDYTAVSEAFIPANQSSVDITVTVTNDGVPEGDETIIPTLAAQPSLYRLGTNTVTSTLFDRIPVFTLTNVQDAVEGGQTGILRINSSFMPVLPITVNYTIEVESTAIPGAAPGTNIDYQTLSGSVILSSSSTTADIVLTAFTDSVFDDGETVHIKLTPTTPASFTFTGAQLSERITINDAQPVVLSVSSPQADGTYQLGDVFTINVLFNQSVDVVGSPQLLLETGTTDRVATYVSGSGTDTLTFTYTVAVTDLSSNLDYHSAAALSLNGGTIQATGSSADAYLVLKDPGTTGSLGFGRARVINGGSDSGKPSPGSVSQDSGGGCGLGGGIAVLATLLMALGIRLRTVKKPC